MISSPRALRPARPVTCDLPTADPSGPRTATRLKESRPCTSNGGRGFPIAWWHTHEWLFQGGGAQFGVEFEHGIVDALVVFRKQPGMLGGQALNDSPSVVHLEAERHSVGFLDDIA